MGIRREGDSDGASDGWKGLSARPRRIDHPGLDGLRGAAVAAVLLFHSGFAWARGGYLGVSTFFTLSGFLITGLLLHEWNVGGRIDLGRFWVRRLRRLLPAQLVMLLGVACFAACVADGDQLRRIRIDALATLAWLANWRFITSGQRYVDLFLAPSPVLHAWSLAIEEQFYVVFPVFVAAVLGWAKAGRRGLAVLLGLLVAASLAVALALGADPSRVYYGTDTRIAELLLGACLALWAADPGVQLAERRRPFLIALGLAASLATLAVWAMVDQTHPWLYRGGFAAYGVVSAVLVAATVAPGPLRTVLAWAPLRGLGLVSYGVYLYHWPIYLWLTPYRTGLGPGALFALQVGLTLVVSVASYGLLEQPIRRGTLRGPRAVGLAVAASALVAVAVLATTITPGPPGRLVDEAPLVVFAADPDTSVRFAGEVRTASAADPLRVLLVGDSVSWDAEPAITAALRATGAAIVTARNERGFGLTAGAFDWRQAWPGLVRDARPELVVAFFGGWDERFIVQHGSGAYDALVDEALAVLRAGGARVLVIGQAVNVDRNHVPFGRPSRDALRAAAVRHAPGVAFLDLDPVLSPGARFASHLAGPRGPERVRKLDGTHLCPAGAARIARAVLDALTPAWHLPAPPPAWRAGAWALDPRFDDPHGACPE